MSKSIISKIAAVACSVAALGALGISASAQFDTELDKRTDLVAGKTNIVAGIVEAEAGETVKFPVYVANNTGYAATGVRLIYDEKLAPVLKANGNPTTKKDDAGDDVTMTFSHNPEKRIIALGTMGTEPEVDSGVMYTVEITVPETAQPGDKFPMTIEIDKWLDEKVQPVDHATVNGYIIVKGDPIPTTTTTTETTTETTTTTTTTVTEPTTTSSDVTTTTTDSTTSGTTTTTGKGGAVVTTTTKKAGTTSNTTASKTGDAGVGVAVAGLLLAAGTAVVATKKKKD